MIHRLQRIFLMSEKSTLHFATTILTAYFYVFMEWIFFVTKPSFMDYMSTGEKISIFFSAGFFVSILACALLLAFTLIEFTLNRFVKSTIPFQIFPASMLISFLGLIIADNFTYTIFEFGIISSTNFTKPLYILLFCFLLYYTSREFQQFITPKKNNNLHKQTIKIALFFIIISIVFIAREQFQIFTVQDDEGFSASENIRKPNIIIFGTDGLDASHMSLYGYKRETTPVIDELAKTSLVAENHFSNACCTIGSTASTLTGKSPLENHFLVYPDILQDKDTYQHFINILNQEGYYTAQWGDERMVNGNKWNMISGFDLLNGNQNQQEQIIDLKTYLGDNASYLIVEIESRLMERILHILYIKDMEKPITSVESVDNRPEVDSDGQKIKEITRFIKHNTGPFFIHTHLLNTHGDVFRVNKQVFSAGKTGNKNWHPDFMDDSILQYDQYIERVLVALQKAGQMDNTIFIVYTDHGTKWAINKRIPLVIYFPGGEHAGKIDANTQNLDIAPTLLDYMNLPQPEWMHGSSLLAPIDKHRLIFSFDRADTSERKPPFFQFGVVQAIECQKWYSLDLSTNQLQSGEIDGHTAPCNTESLHSVEEIRSSALNLLLSNGFNVSNLTAQ